MEQPPSQHWRASKHSIFWSCPILVILAIYNKRLIPQSWRPPFRALVIRLCSLKNIVWKAVTTGCSSQQLSLATRKILFNDKALKRPWLLRRFMFTAMLFVDLSMSSQNAVTFSGFVPCAEAISTGEGIIVVVHLMLADGWRPLVVSSRTFSLRSYLIC